MLKMRKRWGGCAGCKWPALAGGQVTEKMVPVLLYVGLACLAAFFLQGVDNAHDNHEHDENSAEGEFDRRIGVVGEKMEEAEEHIEVLSPLRGFFPSALSPGLAPGATLCRPLRGF